MTSFAGEVLCTEVVPRIRSAVPAAVISVGAEDHEELTQDTIAIAASILDAAESSNKKITPGTVAFYAVKLAKSGRRSTGASRTDVMHPGTQLAGRTRLASLDEPIGNDEMGDPLTLGDVLADDREDPSMTAARQMDWDGFLAGQTRRACALLRALVEGGTFRDVARLVGASDSGIQVEKRKVARALKEYMGAGILAEIGRQPLWRNNIMAGRERRACRAARINHSAAGGAAHA